jgi:hypothetical integral membrane protein (TIGR02206 family)
LIPLPDNQLYYLHNFLTLVMLAICIVLCYAGYKLQNITYKKYISIGIIAFCMIQEVLDYLNRIYFDELYNISIVADLPLQLCSIGFYLSIFGIIMAFSSYQFNEKFEQFIFDCTYVLGFGGAFQALITVDLTGVNNMIGIFSLNWAHSLIILNVLWLIFAYHKRFNVKSIISAFLFLNFLILPVGFINYILDANYMFLCSPPNVENSFFIGDWPYYLFYLEGIYFIYIIFLYMPFLLLNKLNNK